MENSILLDYKSVLENNKTSLVNAIHEYNSEDIKLNNYISEIESIYSNKLKDVKPYIMVYGIYNAGKSSIINELLGDDLAAVNDKPETDSVDEYEWNGYTIADTPGVGAPIKHEEVTTEHLRRADIVMFVMASTGSNEKNDNYRRLKAITDAGKKVIIIINDKNGDLGSNDQELGVIISKVKDNLRQYNLDSNDYVITIVNAKRARDGRIKNKPALIEKSNIQELKGIILSELKKTNNYIVINNAILDILTQINSIQSYLLAYDNKSEIIALNNLLGNIRDAKKVLKSNMSEFITLKANKLLPIVESDIWENKENEDKISMIFNDHIQNLNQDIVKKLENELAITNQDIFSHITEVTKEIEDKLKALETHKEKFSFDVNKSDYSETIGESIKSNNSEIENLKNVLVTSKELLDAHNKDKSIMPLIAAGVGLSTTETLSVVEVGGAVASALAKTSLGSAILSTSIGGTLATAATTLGTALSTAMPYLAPVIIAFIGIKKFFGGGKSQKQLQAEVDAYNEAQMRKVEAMEDARNDLHNKLGYAFDGLITELQKEINKVIDELLGGYEKIYGEKISGSQQEKEAYDKVMSSIAISASNYEELSLVLRNNV
ncbi:GTPase [uncultured Veillonella sp.]|jgi:putative GTP-binding protein|uniref:GTPase n=1 Tax=uncultured Veillonella sp. TaxID=159268 RepID=UPI002598AAF8|nr:GTPase [uncultured Veillonella sp.]